MRLATALFSSDASHPIKMFSQTVVIANHQVFVMSSSDDAQLSESADHKDDLPDWNKFGEIKHSCQSSGVPGVVGGKCRHFRGALKSRSF